MNLGAGVGFYVSIDTPNVQSSSSYAKFWVNEGGENIGLEVDFTGHVSISLGTGSRQHDHELCEPDPSTAPRRPLPRRKSRPRMVRPGCIPP